MGIDKDTLQWFLCRKLADSMVLLDRFRNTVAVLLLFAGMGNITLCGAQSVDSLEYPEFFSLAQKAEIEIDHGGPVEFLQLADSLMNLAGSDSLLLGISQFYKGTAHLKFRDVKTSLKHLLRAYHYFRRHNNKWYLAKTYVALARLKHHRQEFRTSLDYYRKAEELFSEVDSQKKELYKVWGNEGVMYAQMAQMDSARSAFEKVYQLALAEGDSVALIPYYLNMGQIYVMSGEMKRAGHLVHNGLALSRRVGDMGKEANALTVLAYYHFADGDFLKSLEYDSLALELHNEMGSVLGLLNPLNRMSQSYAAMGDFRKSRDVLLHYSNLKDSLFKMEREALITSMESRLNLLEKDYAIELLQTREKASHRKMWVYLALFGMALAIILILVIRWRKERQLHRVEKQLIERDLKLEQLQMNQLQKELDHTAQLLTNESLQKIRKNEQMGHFRRALEELETDLPDRYSDKFGPLKSKLQFAEQDDKYWQHFEDLFARVHPDFIERINQFPLTLTEKEKRLCALIRVNMQNTEIASVLGISPNSVKTARYRLRKKLPISEADDLNTFIQQL